MVTISTRTSDGGANRSSSRNNNRGSRASSIAIFHVAFAVTIFVAVVISVLCLNRAARGAWSTSTTVGGGGPMSIYGRFGPPNPDSSSSSSSNSMASGMSSSTHPPVVIAHAVSLIKCKAGSSVNGFLDAAAVLRQSIHGNSVHSTKKSSRYSYKMYAIVHTSCEEHASVLKRLGYEILVRDHPVKKEDIRGEYLRNHIEGENCCGSAEFIKLYGES
jgi:hypothetical protein